MFTGYGIETPDFVMGCKEYWGEEAEAKEQAMIEKGRAMKRGPHILP